jgi:hypothetical protein
LLFPVYTPLMPLKHRPIARWFKILGGCLLLICGLFLAVELGSRWGADYYLRERARIPVRIGRLFINPANSRVSVSFAGNKPGQELNLDLGTIRFDWWTVFLKRLRVGRLHVKGVQLEIERDAEGTLTVGDIPLASPSPANPSGPAGPATNSSGRPWGLGVGGIDLEDIQIDYHDPHLKMAVVVKRFHMDPAESWRPDAPTPFEGDFTLNGGAVHLSGVCRPFRADPLLDTRVQFTALPLAWLGPILGRPQLDGQFDGTVSFDGLEIHRSTAAPAVRLQKFELSRARLAIADRSYHPAFRWTAESMNLKIADIDTADPKAVVPFSFDAAISRYETIALKGRASPFGAVPDGQLDLKVSGFSLTPFTPIAEKEVGYRVATGRVNLKTNVLVRRGQLQAENQFAAHNFHLEKLRADELDETARQIGLPINLCLSLLREADDTIRLDVPLTGDLRDPSLPIGKLVRQMLGKAMVASLRAAATAFFPSGSHLGFEPVLFAPGEATLLPEGLAYLQKVGEKLSQRPAVGLKLSGWAVSSDWYALHKKKMPEPPAALDAAKISAADHDRLLALAARRIEALRTALSAMSPIDMKRLTGTAPQLDLAIAAKPRAELALP